MKVQTEYASKELNQLLQSAEKTDNNNAAHFLTPKLSSSNIHIERAD